MNQLKKQLSFLLTAVLCLSMSLPASASQTTLPVVYNTMDVTSANTAIVDKNGTLWMWGAPTLSTFQEFDLNKYYLPHKIMDNVASISKNSYHTAIITTDGQLWMYGYNTYGQLGNGSWLNSSDNRIPHFLMDNVSSVSCGPNHTAAIKTDGSLWVWGSNARGELGTGTFTSSATPIKLMDDVKEVTCSLIGNNTTVLKTDGTVWAWGKNFSGGLGNGQPGTMLNSENIPCQTTPVKIMDGVATLSDGDGQAAIKNDGSLWMWGSNSSYLFGRDNNTQTTPVKMMEDVAAVSCSGGTAAVIKNDGSFWLWGNNRYGQLGNARVGDVNESTYNGEETWTMQSTPIKLMDGVAAVRCGQDSVIMLKADGTFWTWGRNDCEHLGYAGGDYKTSKDFGFICQTTPKYVRDDVMFPDGAVISSLPNVAGFTDVSPDDYFSQAVEWAKNTGITSGTSKTTFSPNSTVTRGEAVTFLWRAAGSPKATMTTVPFSDVTNPAAYYYDAICWAYECGIVDGVGNGQFGLNQTLTYDQILLMLCRAKGVTTVGSDWSQVAMNWATDAGLIEGLSVTAKGNCHRSDTVYFLWKTK